MAAGGGHGRRRGAWRQDGLACQEGTTGDPLTQLVHGAARELLVDVVDGRGDVGECGGEGIMAGLSARGRGRRGVGGQAGRCGEMRQKSVTAGLRG